MPTVWLMPLSTTRPRSPLDILGVPFFSSASSEFAATRLSRVTTGPGAVDGDDDIVGDVECAIVRGQTQRVEKLAVVSTAPELPNVTMPGPLNFDQVVVRGPVWPSSETVPSRLATFGSVMVWSEPAFTDGGWLAAPTLMATSSETLSAPSSAVSRRM